MKFTDELRKNKEEELTVFLTDMLEKSRNSLTEEIIAYLKDDVRAEAIEECIDTINKDIDSKLKMIPDTIKALLDDADGKAQRAFDKQYGKAFFGDNV